MKMYDDYKLVAILLAAGWKIKGCTQKINTEWLTSRLSNNEAVASFPSSSNEDYCWIACK